MKKLWFILMAGLCLLVPQVVADDDEAFDSPSSRRSAKSKSRAKDKVKDRDVRKAASRKRKELRDMGVKNVRVKSPGDWPRKVSVPKATEVSVSQPPAGVQGNYYTSNHFCYISPVALDPAAQKTVARLCECAYAANKAIGEVLPVPRTAVDRGDKKFVVQLWPNKESYVANGGPANSAGVFVGAMRRVVSTNPDAPRRVVSEEDIVMDKVMIPFPSLGLGSNGKVQSEDINTHALVHELTHQQFLLNVLPIWANEGWAEYVGYVPYVGEDLDFDRGFALILHAAKAFSENGALDFDFPLADFFTMDQQTMYGYMPQGKNTYMLAAMTVAFYVHLDGKRGVEAMKSYMQALIDGATHEEAAEKLIAPYKTSARLQQAFIRAWKGKKVKVSFPKK